MRKNRLVEYKETDISEPIKSFKTKKYLNPVVWKSKDKIRPNIRKELLEIANDIWAELNVDFDYEDVILTGSLANYNWSSYSDFDLHIILDYSKIDRNIELVDNYLYEVKANWNNTHNITIFGYDVEIFLQNSTAAHVSTGYYSIVNDKWIVVPKPFHVKLDEDAIAQKAEEYMTKIDEIEKESLTEDYDLFKDKLQKVWDKIKKGRQAGLESGGELSVENLVFKLLRRNGYIEKLVDMKLKAYDKHRTIKNS